MTDNALPDETKDHEAAVDAGPMRGINTAPVSAWLAENVEGAIGPFAFDFITGGHSNLTYKVTGSDGSEFVLRRPPLGAILASAHDMGREFKIISGVGRTTVPVPQALGLCQDEEVNGAPFYIMNYVDGVVVADDVTALASLPDPSTRQTLSTSVIDVLAALHRADPDTIGLGDLGRKDAYLDRQLRRWATQWEKAKTRELPEMDEAHALLVAAKPEQRYTGIVHGDYRLGNMLSDPATGTVKAVLDWELCTLGDVLADLGYILNNWAQPGEPIPVGATAQPPTTIGGFATRDELVARYSQQTGYEVADIDYYRAFQYWRLAAIVEGVLNRYLQGVMGDDSVDTDQYSQQVVSLVTNALTLLK
ncbi:MAG: phosphotransferase family protein [Actinomycetota bacterium]|nr:phosphotransferase family protein [Actinomycetota bacterium]